VDGSECLSWCVARCVVLAPSDFCFFPKLKEFMKGHKVSDDENVICSANGWLEDQEQPLLYNGIRTLEKRWTKCISVHETMLKSDKI